MHLGYASFSRATDMTQSATNRHPHKAPSVLNRACLLGTLLLASGSSLAKPSTELPEAMRMAEAYVSGQGIPNTGRYLASVVWHEQPGHPEKSCWSVMWRPNEPALDAQLVVWVCSDGRIHHQAGAWG